MKRVLVSVAAIGILASGAVWAAGLFPGFPNPTASTNTYPMTGNEIVPVDTLLPNGISPQTETPTIQQIANAPRGITVIPFGTSLASDYSAAGLYQVTLTASTATLANPTNLSAGKKTQYEIIQGGSGSYTLAYGSLFKWVAGTAPTLSTTVGYKDLIECTYDNAVLLCNAALGFH